MSGGSSEYYIVGAKSERVNSEYEGAIARELQLDSDVLDGHRFI